MSLEDQSSAWKDLTYIKQRPFKNLISVPNFFWLNWSFLLLPYSINSRKNTSKEGREMIVKGEQQWGKKKDNFNIKCPVYGRDAVQLDILFSKHLAHFQKVKYAPTPNQFSGPC